MNIDLCLRNKQRIAQNFSLAAPLYDRYSLPQFSYGSYLIKLIKATYQTQLRQKAANSGTQRLENGLDIGCGTGRLTEKLLKSIQPLGLARVSACDLAPQMIDYAHKHHAAPPIHYWVGDIETIMRQRHPTPPVKRYQLIFSNITLHWLANLMTFFQNCTRYIAPGGMLAFSLYANGTYQELEDLYQTSRQQDDCHTAPWSSQCKFVIDLPHLAEVRHGLQRSGWEILAEKTFHRRLYFKHYHAFHTYQRYTGARNDRAQQLFSGKAHFNRWRKQIDVKTTQAGGLYTSVILGYFIARQLHHQS